MAVNESSEETEMSYPTSGIPSGTSHFPSFGVRLRSPLDERAIVLCMVMQINPLCNESTEDQVVEMILMANDGSTTAMTILGMWSVCGTGMEYDLSVAHKWFRRAFKIEYPGAPEDIYESVYGVAIKAYSS